MKTRRTAGFLASFCIAVIAPAAVAQSPQAIDTAQRLFERNGLAVQVHGFRKQVVAQIEQQRGKLPDPILGALAEAANEAFRPELLRDDLVDGIAKKLELEHMERAIEWLGTAAGRRVTRAEELSSTTADDAARRQFFESLKDHEPSAARVRLVHGVIAATYAEDSTVRGLQAMALGVAYGLDSTQPAEKRIGMARLRTQVEAALPAEALKEQLRSAMPALYLFTYRGISDADLGEYVRFLQGPGKRYSEQVQEVMIDTLVGAAIRLGQLVDQRSPKLRI